jgi:hypothetical protein
MKRESCTERGPPVPRRTVVRSTLLYSVGVHTSLHTQMLRRDIWQSLM